MTTDMRASLTVTADASRLVAEMRKGSEGLRELRRETEAASAAAEYATSTQGRMAAQMAKTVNNGGGKSARNSAAVFEGVQELDAFNRERADQAARSYRAIEESLNPVIRAERELAAAQAIVNRALAEGVATNSEAARSLQQLDARFTQIQRSQSKAAQSAKVFEAAIEAEAQAMRQLTLAVDPAALAQEEFSRAQTLVTRSVRSGTITQAEGIRVMQLFETRQKALGAGGVTMGMGVQNASFQLADFAVQVQGGQAASLALAQQLPQLLGGFGVLGAVLGAAVAIGVPLISMLFKSGDAAGSLDDRLQKLEGALSNVKEKLELLDDSRLGETFGSMTDDIRSMTRALLDLERAAELKSLEQTLDKLLRKNIDPSVLQILTAPAPSKTQLDTGNFTPVDLREKNYAKLTGGRGPSFDQFTADQAEISALAKAGEVEQVVSRVSALINEFTAGGPVTDLNADLTEILRTLGLVAQQTAETEAQFNGSARAKAITREIDDMVRGYSQQADLSRAILKFGEDSAEVEAVRARQAREALTLRLDEMKVAQGSAEANRAMGALEADLSAAAAMTEQQRRKDRDALISDLGRQNDLSAVVLRFGRDSAEAEALRAQQARAVNDERLKEMGLAPGLLALAQKLFALEQQRAEQIKKSEADKKAQLMISGLSEQAALNDATVKFGRDSLQVKELQIAAERRQYQESLKTLGVSAERKRQLMAEWEQAKGLASADPFGQIAASRDMLKTQRENIAQLRLEQALLGQSEATRSRILALWKTEQEIRRRGIDTTSARAAEIRAVAQEEETMARSLDRQAKGWNRVETAAESAFDTIFDKLAKGDWEAGLEELAQNVSGTLYELAIKNPAKNAALGKDLPTMADVGGLRGIWDRLTNRGDGSDIALPEAVSNLATMDVQAATVIIGGPGAMNLLASMPGAANAISPPGTFSGLGGNAGVQSQIWEFFSAKGLQPHQVAAIMGQASAESAFNPNAVGDNGTSFGLFQHHAGRGRGLLDAVGGQAGLGDVNAQLEYVWKELLTSESGVLKQLMSATTLKDATVAAVGFERPQGWSAANPTGAHNFEGRLAAADASLVKFGNATQTATGDLGTLGNGMGVFGTALQGLAQGGPAGALQGVLGSIGTVVAGALKIPGFAMGGDFVGGMRIVGENGPELEFTGPSRIMNADLTRQLMTARPQMMPANTATAPDTRPMIRVINQSSVPMTGEVNETTDSRGQRQYELVVADMVGTGLGKRGGQASRTMRNLYGVGPAPRRRG